MKTVKLIFLFFLFAAILSLSNGCATLPNVSEMIDEAPVGQKQRQIVSSKGLLSPQKSKAIMECLKLSVNPGLKMLRFHRILRPGKSFYAPRTVLNYQSNNPLLNH
jgi:hypothetical protein